MIKQNDTPHQIPKEDVKNSDILSHFAITCFGYAVKRKKFGPFSKNLMLFIKIASQAGSGSSGDVYRLCKENNVEKLKNCQDTAILKVFEQTARTTMVRTKDGEIPMAVLVMQEAAHQSLDGIVHLIKHEKYVAADGRVFHGVLMKDMGSKTISLFKYVYGDQRGDVEFYAGTIKTFYSVTLCTKSATKKVLCRQLGHFEKTLGVMKLNYSMTLTSYAMLDLLNSYLLFK